MAYGMLRFESSLMNTTAQSCLILPNRGKKTDPKEYYGSGKKYKILWLLPGTGSGFMTYMLNAKIKVYAEERDLAVATVYTRASDYTEWDNFGMGYDAWRYLTDELMPLVYNWFPISDRREDNFIAGMSMGGRGTMKYALAYPEKFAGAAIISGSIRNYRVEYDQPWEELMQRDKNVLNNAGGLDAYCNSMDCSYERLLEVKDCAKLPKLFFSFGTKDKSYERYCENKKRYEELGINAHYLDIPDIAHEPRALDIGLENALEYFGLHKK